MFYLVCSFRWLDYYNETDFVSLAPNEIFDGKDYEIDLEGVTEWEGLLGIVNTVRSLDQAPLIRNLHMRNGETSVTGGFIVRPFQQFFIVDGCTTTGLIKGLDGHPFAGGGGICGQECAHNGGSTVISNSYSTGVIGYSAGGIAGRELAKHGGTANITNCHSYGTIEGRIAGGITGRNPGLEGGKIFIKGCYSKGQVLGRWSGGICGGSAGVSNGHVIVSRSFSSGDIDGQQSGGIAGAWAGSMKGALVIKNCYSAGNLNGENCGGIVGGVAGHTNGYVLIRNVYSSGMMRGLSVGGVIGSVDGNDPGEVVVQYSVYNGGGTGFISDDSEQGLDTKNNYNSNNILEIYGKIYCHPKGCWDKRIWQETPNGYPKLILNKSKAKSPSKEESQFLEQFLMSAN